MIFGNLASALQSRMQGAWREQLRRMISHRRPASDGICEPCEGRTRRWSRLAIAPCGMVSGLVASCSTFSFCLPGIARDALHKTVDFSFDDDQLVVRRDRNGRFLPQCSESGSRDAFKLRQLNGGRCTCQSFRQLYSVGPVELLDAAQIHHRLSIGEYPSELRRDVRKRKKPQPTTVLRKLGRSL